MRFPQIQNNKTPNNLKSFCHTLLQAHVVSGEEADLNSNTADSVLDMAIQAQLYPANAAIPLCGSQDLIIEKQSCFNSQHHIHQPVEQQRLQLERNLNMSLILSTSNATNINHPSTQVGFHNQRDDVDYFIRLQSEKLRIMLQEQRKQQVAALLKKVEADAIYVLRQKDEQIAQATKKRAELEELLTRLEAENELWRRVAQENEAMVLSLHNTLEQLQINNGVAMEDAESCCDHQIRRNMAMEEGTGDSQQITTKNMLCKGCNSGRSCFMFLPCRHLSSCKACHPFLQACPLCTMPKKSSIEIRDFDFLG